MTNNTPFSRLVRISDTNLTLEHAMEDIRGFSVIDSSGADIGHVDDLMIDEDHRKVRFLVVAAGGFLGFGEKRFWLPVDAVINVIEDIVKVDTTLEHLKTAPAYDPEIVPSHPYADDVYAYYGITPYWGSGYVYPPYPYFMGGAGSIS